MEDLEDICWRWLTVDEWRRSLNNPNVSEEGKASVGEKLEQMGES